MSTPKQIEANRQNAQLSSGPVSDIGKQTSSKNSTRHGFTGQNLIIGAAEKEHYEKHVQAYLAHHKASDHKHVELVQQLADLHWSLHQIFVQQTNAMALMNAITEQMLDSGDPVAIAAAIAPVARTLNTLSTYEGRKRRAAKTVLQDLTAYEQTLNAQRLASLKPENTANQPQIGSVCSGAPTAEEVQAYKDQFDAFFREVEAELGPEEAAKIRKELGPEVI
jgi:hypothetical protein